jgi:hypothetical protein
VSDQRTGHRAAPLGGKVLVKASGFARNDLSQPVASRDDGGQDRDSRATEMGVRTSGAVGGPTIRGWAELPYQPKIAWRTSSAKVRHSLATAARAPRAGPIEAADV